MREAPFIARLAMDSWEYDRWARQLLSAGSPAEPFFQAPLYPYLLAAVYALAGHRLDAVYLGQIVLAVAGLYALYRAGRWFPVPPPAPAEQARPLRSSPAPEVGRQDGPRVGLWAAALAAVYGPFLFYDVQLLKESLAVTAVAFLLWALAEARAKRLWGRWALAGALAGVIALLRENMLLVAPALLLLTLEGWRVRRRSLVGAGAFTAAFALMLLPSALHNLRTGGGFLPTTFQGGVNFYIGNNPEADGTYRPIVPGKQVPFHERREPVRLAEEALGRPLSAAEVSRYWWGRALAWARREPAVFARLQLAKLGLFWEPYERPDAVDYEYMKEVSPVLGLPLLEFGGVTALALAGLWLVRRRLGRWAPVPLFAAAWMLSVVVFFLFSRYRLPALPALLLLAAAVPAVAVEAFRSGRRGRAAALAGLAAAAWLLPPVLTPGPRWDLVHYNLGRLADEAGDPEEAVRHYRAALEANPDDFLSSLNLGSHAARAGRYREAREWFRRAVEIEPRFDDAWANLGSAHLALGELAAADEALGKALALNPRNPTALHSRALTALRRGDPATARELNRRLLALDPEHPQARRLEERLRRLEQVDPGPAGRGSG